jgi:pimeloyl-ACP methyl ester carboxylesterase
MLPSAIRRQGERTQFGDVPVLLIRPEVVVREPSPLLIWIHGRTACKELDSGRYLRLMRRGFGVCAIDLPGHGDRPDLALQDPDRVLEVVMQVAGELDAVAEAAATRLGADRDRVAIGGMSAGGMACAARLCQPHRFAAVVFEATSGDWSFLPDERGCVGRQRDLLDAFNPIEHLEKWRPLPSLAIHSRLDQWIPFASQWRFLDAIEACGPDSLIERVAYDHTGAPGEHAGFGSRSADAKEQFCRFLEQRLLAEFSTGATSV